MKTTFICQYSVYAINRTIFFTWFYFHFSSQEICRSCEQTQHKLRDINNLMEKTYAVLQSASQRKGGLPNCKYCNRKHEFSKSKYSAYGKRCQNCGKQNHFAICCKVKRNEHSSWVVKEDNGSPLYYTSNSVYHMSPEGTLWFVDLQRRLDKRETPVVMSCIFGFGFQVFYEWHHSEVGFQPFLLMLLGLGTKH